MKFNVNAVLAVGIFSVWTVRPYIILLCIFGVLCLLFLSFVFVLFCTVCTLHFCVLPTTYKWPSGPSVVDFETSCRCKLNTAKSYFPYIHASVDCDCVFLIYTVSQKTSSFLLFKYLCQKLTDFNDFWCVKSEKIRHQ